MLQTSISNIPKVATSYFKKPFVKETKGKAELDPDLKRSTYRVSLCCKEVLSKCSSRDTKVVAFMALIKPIAKKYNVDPNRISRIINPKR